MTKILIFIIKIYQYFVSPFLGNRCRFFPTCSEYYIEALKTQGLLAGLKLGAKRILKWKPKVSFKNLVKDMVVSDLEFVKKSGY